MEENAYFLFDLMSLRSNTLTIPFFEITAHFQAQLPSWSKQDRCLQQDQQHKKRQWHQWVPRRGGSQLRWASLQEKPQRRMTSSGCPFQDHLDPHSATISTRIAYLRHLLDKTAVSLSLLVPCRVRIGSWVSRTQVIARAEDADGKLISIKSTVEGEVTIMGRKVYDRLIEELCSRCCQVIFVTYLRVGVQICPRFQKEGWLLMQRRYLANAIFRMPSSNSDEGHVRTMRQGSEKDRRGECGKVFINFKSTK